MSEHHRVQHRGRVVAIGMAAALALGAGGYAALTASAHADDDVAGAGVVCPRLNDLVGNVPGAARPTVDRALSQLDEQLRTANRQLAGAGDGVQRPVLGPLHTERARTIDLIGNALARAGAGRPQGIKNLVLCSLKAGGAQSGPSGVPSGDAGSGTPGSGTPGSGTAGSGTPSTPAPSTAASGGGTVGAGAPSTGAPGGSPGGQAADGSGFAGGLSAADFIDIGRVRPAAQDPALQAGPSRGTFTPRCGVSDHNNSDNFIVAPGVSDGAHHVHDYVGNQTTDGFSTDAGLAAAGTSCSGRDKSAYFWPVLRLTRAGDQGDAGESGGLADQNTGTKLKPASVQIRFGGNARSKVTAMPEFLRIITGDAKAVSNGTANARAQWTCAGSENRRLTDKYPLCGNSPTVRILDFPSCWDGRNTDSADHRSHVVFPAADGSCRTGFKAVPQLRLTLTYRLPGGSRFAIDSFPSELHKAATDHADFENVMPGSLMNKVVACINSGRRC